MKSILATGLDSQPLDGVAPTTHLPATHAHVRGAAYYDAPAVSCSLTADAVC